MLELDSGQAFDPAREEDFFTAIPQRPGVLLVESMAQLGAVAVLMDDRFKGMLPLFGGIDHALRSEGADDRLDEVLAELDRIRAETGWPPLASPIGQVLASQALLNVLSASRYLVVVDEVRSLVSGAFGTPPAPIDPALERVVQLIRRERAELREIAAVTRDAGRHDAHARTGPFVFNRDLIEEREWSGFGRRAFVQHEVEQNRLFEPSIDDPRAVAVQFGDPQFAAV